MSVRVSMQYQQFQNPKARWSDIDETWHVYSTGLETQCLESRILNFNSCATWGRPNLPGRSINSVKINNHSINIFRHKRNCWMLVRLQTPTKQNSGFWPRRCAGPRTLRRSEKMTHNCAAYSTVDVTSDLYSLSLSAIVICIFFQPDLYINEWYT